METMSVLQAGGCLVHGGELKYVETIFSLLDYLTQKIVSLSEVQHLLESLWIVLDRQEDCVQGRELLCRPSR